MGKQCKICKEHLTNEKFPTCKKCFDENKCNVCKKNVCRIIKGEVQEMCGDCFKEQSKYCPFSKNFIGVKDNWNAGHSCTCCAHKF